MKAPTPETDAAWKQAKNLKYVNGTHAYWWSARDMMKLAKKLERERDEARALLIKNQ
jgi:hypothetical protein